MSANRLRKIADRTRSRSVAMDLLAIADEHERMQRLLGGESFHAIRLVGGDFIYGDFIYGDYAWMGCDGPNDWTVAEDSWAGGDDSEYEIVVMHVEPVAKRKAPPPFDDDEYDCIACWKADGWVEETRPKVTCPDCGFRECPKADAHVNSCSGVQS